jgi:hypothetical protein
MHVNLKKVWKERPDKGWSDQNLLNLSIINNVGLSS